MHPQPSPGDHQAIDSESTTGSRRASMAQYAIDQHLVLKLPEHLQIMELTATGPHQKSHDNIVATGEKNNTVWFHIMKEEYEQIAGGIHYHPDDREASIGLKIPSRVASKLRYPWLHGSMFQHHAHAVFHTSWLMSKNRVATSHSSTSYLVGCRPSLWRLHDYHAQQGQLLVPTQHQQEHPDLGWQL